MRHPTRQPVLRCLILLLVAAVPTSALSAESTSAGKLSPAEIMQLHNAAVLGNAKERNTAYEILLKSGETGRKALLRILLPERKKHMGRVKSRIDELVAHFKQFKTGHKLVKEKRRRALEIIYDSSLDKDEAAQKKMHRLRKEIWKHYEAYVKGRNAILTDCGKLVKAFKRLNEVDKAIERCKPDFSAKYFKMRRLPELSDGELTADDVDMLFALARDRKNMKELLAACEDGDADISRPERNFIKALNEYRISMGRKPLRASPKLCKAARKHSAEMVKMGYFSHTSPVPEHKSFGQRAKLEGYRGARAENIFKGNAGHKAALNAWIHSPGHHRNLLADGHNDTGIGLVGKTWTNMFGKSRR